MSGVSISPPIVPSCGANKNAQRGFLNPGSERGGESIAIFYINRDIDEDRRDALRAELENAGVSGVRLPAVEGLNVPNCLRSYFFEADRLHSHLKPGEVGCYASHLMAHRLILELGLPYAVVLEDDAVPAASLESDIKKIVAALPDCWDVVHLSGDPTRAFKPIAYVNQVGALVRYSRVPTGTVGYLINRRGAQKFLQPIKRYWPVDTDFRRPWVFGLEVFGIVPRLISHRSTPTSPISALGGRSRRRRGISLPSNEAWTGNPLYCPEAVYFNLRRLGSLWWVYCWVRNFRSKLLRPFARVRRVELANGSLDIVR